MSLNSNDQRFIKEGWGKQKATKKMGFLRMLTAAVCLPVLSDVAAVMLLLSLFIQSRKVFALICYDSGSL